MLQKLQKRKQEGFTIIEVLIVLAIAGLILLVVFLAVPALQRNSRNTQRKNDAAAILGGISEYTNNNGGQVPTSLTVSGNDVTIAGGAGTNSTTAKIGYFNSGTVTLATSVPSAPDNNTIVIVKGAVCSGNTPTMTGGSARSYVAYFATEPSGTQCVSS